jgi:hypothetical protein
LSKEHSGGTPEVGFELAVHFGEDVSFPVPVVEVDHSHLDSVEDRVKEALLLGHKIRPIIVSMARAMILSEKVEAITQLMALLMDAEKPRLLIDQIAYATNMYLRQGLSMPELARKHGISKQAMQQGVERVQAQLGLPKTRTMRDEGGREKMRLRNRRATA